MKKLKATRFVAVLGVSLLAAGASIAQTAPTPQDQYGDYVTDNGGGYDATGGINAWNTDYGIMCGAPGPNSLESTGNAAEPVWTAPLCPSAG